MDTVFGNFVRDSGDSSGKTESSGHTDRPGRSDRSGRTGFYDFVCRRAYGLLLPYFVFDILALGIQTVLSYWRGGTPEAVMKLQNGMVRIFTFQGLGPDWFLPALFVGELLFELCLRSGGKSIAEIRQYSRHRRGSVLPAGGSKHHAAEEAAQEIPAALAVLFAVSVVTVFCLGGSRLAVLGPFRFVIVKGLAAAGFLALGYVCMPVMGRVLGSVESRQATADSADQMTGSAGSTGSIPTLLLPAAAVSLAGTLLIAGHYNLDFNQLDFGSRPLFLYADTLCGTCFVLCISRIPDLLSGILGGKLPPNQDAFYSPGKLLRPGTLPGPQPGTLPGFQTGLWQEFGRESLTIMCTHLEWQIVPIIHFGWAAVAGMSPQEGKRFYVEMLIKLCLVMAAELGLIRVLHSLMPWLYRRKRIS